MVSRLFALLLVLPVPLRAQEVLPAKDPTTSLARLAADDRQALIGRKLAVEYAPSNDPWKLVHACVRRDEGLVKAMKQSFSRQFKEADRDPWKAYALAVQAYHLHHAGDYPKHLRDTLATFLNTWERGMFARQDSSDPFRDGPLPLVTACCAAALLPPGQLPATHAFSRESLDRLRNAPPARLVTLNATLHAALISGRIGEFKNDEWRSALDRLRDTLPPNGCAALDPVRNPSDDLYSDRGAALRIAAVLFAEFSFLPAADKYQVATGRHPGRPGARLSPLQWAYLSYESLGRMPPTPARSQGRLDFDTASKPTLLLRAGDHPRAPFFLVAAPPESLTAPGEFWVGGSLLGRLSVAKGFIVSSDGPEAGEAGRIDFAPVTGEEAAEIDRRNGDEFGRLTFRSEDDELTLTRHFVLTREGILVVADLLEGGTAAQRAGPVWPIGEKILAKGAHWFAYPAIEHYLPPGYEGRPFSGLVWFAPDQTSKTGAADESAFQSAPAGPEARTFLSVVVPFREGRDPSAIARAVSTPDTASVQIGKVTITVDGDRWSVRGNGRPAP